MDDTVKAYAIAGGDTIRELVETVNLMLLEGWQPRGDVQFVHDDKAKPPRQWVQAMVQIGAVDAAPAGTARWIASYPAEWTPSEVAQRWRIPDGAKQVRGWEAAGPGVEWSGGGKPGVRREVLLETAEDWTPPKDWHTGVTWRRVPGPTPPGAGEGATRA